MGYTLEAIIAPAESITRFMESRDPERVVSLPQGFAMIPLDERTCEVIERSFGFSLEYQFEKIPFEEFNSNCVSVLQELSGGSITALVVIDCHAGECSRRGVVYQNRVKIYDRYALPDYGLSENMWGPKTGLSRIWAGLLSKPPYGWVPNPHRSPTVAAEVFELLGVQCDENHHDAFDALGLGRCRDTEDWLQHEA